MLDVRSVQTILLEDQDGAAQAEQHEEADVS